MQQYGFAYRLSSLLQGEPMSNARWKVVITDLIVEPLSFERDVLHSIADVTALDAMQESELIGRIEDADAIMVYHYFRFTRASIERLEEVADSAIAMAVALSRGTHFLNSRLKRGIGAWNVDQALPIPRLRKRILGIIGCGRIGTAAALRAKAFGFDVLFYDPYVKDGVDKALGVRRVDSLKELLAESYIVSMHCPLTAETRGMIGREQIGWMPAGSYLVNTARGGVVDTLAVIEALADGHLAGAGIDVLEQEPPPADSPVLAAWRDPNHPAHDRLLLNPHTAFYCDEGCEEFRRKGAMEILRAYQGKPLRNKVN
jgi:D-3-phosphoglycerate dehydrogenase/C-terminal binding protein